MHTTTECSQCHKQNISIVRNICTIVLISTVCVHVCLRVHVHGCDFNWMFALMFDFWVNQ